jgi:hypothetical protein
MIAQIKYPIIDSKERNQKEDCASDMINDIKAIS